MVCREIPGGVKEDEAIEVLKLARDFFRVAFQSGKAGFEKAGGRHRQGELTTDCEIFHDFFMPSTGSELQREIKQGVGFVSESTCRPVDTAMLSIYNRFSRCIIPSKNDPRS